MFKTFHQDQEDSDKIQVHNESKNAYVKRQMDQILPESST